MLVRAERQAVVEHGRKLPSSSLTTATGGNVGTFNREPGMHYLIDFSGKEVPLAPHATCGTGELARVTAQAIGPHNAVLMASHGMPTVGKNLASAFATSEIIELMARVFLQAKNVGEPRLLSEAQMDDVLVHSGSCGQGC